MPTLVIDPPIPGELTVASVDVEATSGQADQIEAWARSVAEHRYGG
jgi:hypothetical protein